MFRGHVEHVRVVLVQFVLISNDFFEFMALSSLQYCCVLIQRINYTFERMVAKSLLRFAFTNHTSVLRRFNLKQLKSIQRPRGHIVTQRKVKKARRMKVVHGTAELERIARSMLRLGRFSQLKVGCSFKFIFSNPGLANAKGLKTWFARQTTQLFDGHIAMQTRIAKFFRDVGIFIGDNFGEGGVEKTLRLGITVAKEFGIDIDNSCVHFHSVFDIDKAKTHRFCKSGISHRVFSNLKDRCHPTACRKLQKLRPPKMIQNAKRYNALLVKY